MRKEIGRTFQIRAVFQGITFAIAVQKAREIDMQIPLGGGYRAVTQLILNKTKIGPSRQKVCGTAMSKGVWV